VPLLGRATLTGVGACLPERVVENDELSERLESTDEWIRTRTGIARRHMGGPTSALAVGAGQAALVSAQLSADDIDFLVLATTTPDQQMPQTAAAVQDLLGLHCPAFDMNVACTGFVYAAAVATGLSIAYRRILIIGAEQLSRITDPTDRATAILMADGGGAVVLERSEAPEDDVWADLGSDGSLRGALYADHGGMLAMKGGEVFKSAVRLCSESILRLLDESGTKADDVDLLVPHQANQRIIDAVVARVGLDPARCVSILEDTGNTSAASIPLGLAAAVEAGRVSVGNTVILAGFGAGMAWGSLLVRWGTPSLERLGAAK
jgi:3-oxoacyl-[acyl-carrier-protein] synthase III